ncbi:MAG: hypothetical protein KAH95_13085 [Spirochaetales bacterium]|nr:hypothetical protein [Spirochaetales bacterium]
MRIKHNIYPVIIITVFFLSIFIGLLLGFTPVPGGLDHGKENSPLTGSGIAQTSYIWEYSV